MDLGIKGRVAIITGATDGMGFETARILAAEGVKLVLSDKTIDQLEKDAAALPGDVVCVKADVTDEADVTALVAAAVQRFGTVDIVVHTAGVTGAKGDPLELPDSDYEEAWQIDFMSAVRMARAAIPLMRRSGWGRFVCITSENAVQPYWEEAVYNVAKAALAAFVKNLSYKEAEHGVLCNTVAPAFIETKMTDGMMERRSKEMGVSFDEAVESFLEEERPGIALKRRGKAEEAAAAIAFMVSERASFINGSNLRVDGGSVQAVQN
ncbi:SDR family NAD(P)-dependent oxidoreductase [Mangrovibrevibacter kandeliae]|uniref:SDR family NAD(P)-dependent oxidoreductase n=1 Tax=Mangrovibrevibacter kandeliae TaxID=2968473 RepID=UPI002118E00A|nr:SDR family oxidoreductase [Aurantimonas sp. CSK15Z-1]MCQ8780794.1 SDR family oxidoreductase [Aurantimonas sp. CSK15Z-1]